MEFNMKILGFKKSILISFNEPQYFVLCIFK